MQRKGYLLIYDTPVPIHRSRGGLKGRGTLNEQSHPLNVLVNPGEHGGVARGRSIVQSTCCRVEESHCLPRFQSLHLSGANFHCQTVLTATMVYTVTRIAFQEEAIRVGDPRNLAVRVTRIGFNRTEAGAAHSEDSLHQRAK